MIYRNYIVRFLILIIIHTCTVQTNPLLAHSLSDLPKHSCLRPTSFTNETTELLRNYLPVLQEAVQALRRAEAVVFDTTGQMDSLNGQIKGLELHADRLTGQHDIEKIKKEHEVDVLLRKMNRSQGPLEDIRADLEVAKDKINSLVVEKERLIAGGRANRETRQQRRERGEKIRELKANIRALRRYLNSLLIEMK